VNLLSQAKVSMLTYAGVTSTSVQKTVAAAGTRVCLRAYGMYEYGTWVHLASSYTTRVNFRTTSQSSDVRFSDIVPNFGGYVNLGTGSPMIMIRIPGEGVLFDDGLYIELENITTRTAAMKTLLQVVYT